MNDAASASKNILFLLVFSYVIVNGPLTSTSPRLPILNSARLEFPLFESPNIKDVQFTVPSTSNKKIHAIVVLGCSMVKVPVTLSVNPAVHLLH